MYYASLSVRQHITTIATSAVITTYRHSPTNIQLTTFTITSQSLWLLCPMKATSDVGCRIGHYILDFESHDDGNYHDSDFHLISHHNHEQQRHPSITTTIVYINPIPSTMTTTSFAGSHIDNKLDCEVGCTARGEILRYRLPRELHLEFPHHDHVKQQYYSRIFIHNEHHCHAYDDQQQLQQH